MANQVNAPLTLTQTRTKNVNALSTTTQTRAKTNRQVRLLSLQQDWVVQVATKNISGTVYAVTGLPVAGATVKLFREADDRLCQTQTSDGSGHYLFVRDETDTHSYYVVAYTPGATPQVHGVSDRGGVPV